MASTFADWCKLIQSIEAALAIRDGLAILKTSADAAVAVEGSYGQQAFLGRLVGRLRLECSSGTSLMSASLAAVFRFFCFNPTWNDRLRLQIADTGRPCKAGD